MSEPIAVRAYWIDSYGYIHDDVVDDSNRRRGFLYQCTLEK
jgi:geranylgeranyl pyrophosphate synthase